MGLGGPSSLCKPIKHPIATNPIHGFRNRDPIWCLGGKGKLSVAEEAVYIQVTRREEGPF